MRFSSFRHSCAHILCKVRYPSNGRLAACARALEFECKVLGLEFALLHHIARIQYEQTHKSLVLRGRLVEARLPDDVRVLLRNGTTDIDILKEIHLENMYEKNYHPKVGDVVFDVGSHVGIFTLKASRLVGPTGLVFAFEPEPENFILLKRSVALNKATNVRIFREAVSSRSAMLQLHIHPIYSGMHSVQYGVDRTAKISVPSVTLDQVIRKYDIQEVNLLKLDVEGHELEVLRGADRFLNICKHTAFETHGGKGARHLALKP